MPPLNLFENITQLMHAFKSHMLTGLNAKKLQLTPAHIKMLWLINEQPSCTAQFIAERTKSNKSQITRQVKELLEQKLVIKTPNPNDGRSQYLSLSSKGNEVVADILQVQIDVSQKMTADLSPHDVEHIMQVTQTMMTNLK